MQPTEDRIFTMDVTALYLNRHWALISAELQMVFMAGNALFGLADPSLSAQQSDDILLRCQTCSVY